ncbi:MAG TPA: hypothetical protein VK206_24375 [Anaerolineales bacterium]|nr:hypothetical protein [Anaerolineales bacterium]
MDDKRKQWSEQFNKNLGVRELLRFSCASGIWISLGIAISVAIAVTGYTRSEYAFLLFLITFFIFPIIAMTWLPAYTLFRKILGNENLPAEPMPRPTVKISRQPLPLLYYVLAIWRWILGLLVLYFIIKYVFK